MLEASRAEIENKIPDTVHGYANIRERFARRILYRVFDLEYADSTTSLVCGETGLGSATL